MQASPAGSRRVLVVEPDALTRELLATVLRMAGCEAVAVETGERALHRARAERGSFACLFTEVELPGLVDGWIVADEFRSGNPSCPIIFASDEPDETSPSLNEATVRRPVAPLEVLAAFKGLIGRREVEISGAGWTEPPRVAA